MPDAVTQLVNIRDGYLQALANDALNPVPTHTIDGITVDTNTWRKELLTRIGEINVLLNAFNPQEIRSVIL